MSHLLAIVFLLNGVQVDLPAPALLIGQTSYVPARAVLESLGWTLEWSAERRSLRASAAGLCTYTFTVANPRMMVDCRGCSTPAAIEEQALGAPPTVVNGYLYLPVRALAQMVSGRVEWEAATMTVNLITGPAGSAQAVEIGTLLADPPAWLGRLVVLRGEYTGWQADPFGPATSHGPPVTRSDWTLRDRTGSLYCAVPSGARLPLSLDPQEDLGRRLEVVGTVALTEQAWPYLVVSTVVPQTGLAGLTVYLTTDRHTYRPGDSVRMRMQVTNPTAEAQVLHFSSSQQYDFAVYNPDGEVLWKWSQDKAFAQMLTQRALAPGESYAVTAEWELPATLAVGRYRVGGELNREVQAYAKTISVERE